MHDFVDILNGLDNLKGSYLLFICLLDNIIIEIRKHEITLQKGYYIYVGNAFGAGGLKARIARHIKKNKKIHWHIDKITTHPSSSVIAFSVAINQKQECLISSILSSLPNLRPIYGFGNTDCTQHCASHLFLVRVEETRKS